MKVKELIKELQTYNQEKEVYLSSDSEGNSYGTTDLSCVYEEDKYVLIYPCDEGIDYYDLFEE